jgi:hypothetical protein
MSESQTPIYDQTVEAQGWDPATTVAVEIDGNTATGTLSPEQAAQIKHGNLGGYSIRKGGKAFGRRK